MAYRNRYRNSAATRILYCGDNIAFGRSPYSLPVAPGLPDADKVQAYAAACFASMTKPHNSDAVNHIYNTKGRYAWMDRDVTAHALGIKDRTGRQLSLQALNPNRGATPTMCPEGSTCNEEGCEALATVRVGLDADYAFRFVCHQHINKAESDLRSQTR